MPAPGDQYRDNKASINPFEETVPRISEFTAREIATLQSRLDKQLGPEYISTRPGAGGGKVHYLAAEKVINLANEVFGFNGWSSEIRNVQIDFVDETTSGKISLGLSVISRVTLKDGTFHEDVGYGHIENCKGKAAAFEKAKKEAATDAMKRALRNFGNVLGNCLYDKDYLGKVAKIKIAPSRWSADNLHRHPDFKPQSLEEAAAAHAHAKQQMEQTPRPPVAALVHSNSADVEDEFGGNLFDEVDFSHPDEVRLDETPVRPPSNGPGMDRQALNRVKSMPNIAPQNGGRQLPNGNQPPQPQGQQTAPKPINNGNQQGQQNQGRMLPPQNLTAQQAQRPAQTYVPAQKQQFQNGNRSTSSSASDSGNSRQTTPQAGQNEQQDPPPLPFVAVAVPPNIPKGFVSGSAADAFNTEAAGPAAIKPFDPHFESPSIRRTQGIDLRKSAAVRRSDITTTPKQQCSNAAPNGGPIARPNFVNPSMDPGRRIGAPGAMQSPMANRNAYKPPSKRPLPADSNAARPPLADMSNVQQQLDGANDAKKLKVEKVEPVGPAVAQQGGGTDSTVAS